MSNLTVLCDEEERKKRAKGLFILTASRWNLEKKNLEHRGDQQLSINTGLLHTMSTVTASVSNTIFLNSLTVLHHGLR